MHFEAIARARESSQYLEMEMEMGMDYATLHVDDTGATNCQLPDSSSKLDLSLVESI